MTRLASSVLVLFSALASANQRHISSRDVCSASPLHKHRLEARDGFSQKPLSSAAVRESPPPPWKVEGDCVTTEYEEHAPDSWCAFSSPTFADGRGLSVVTTVERAKFIGELLAFTEAGVHAGVNSDASPPYVEVELPGRGRGLIANRTLYPGDRIFASTPILLLDGEAADVLDEEEEMALDKLAVKALPPAANQMFWKLHGWAGQDPVGDRISTNAFGVEFNTPEEDVDFYVVFPEIARMNHDCRPNAGYFMDQETLVQYVHAVTTITPGTEISITYIDPRMPRQDRLDSLHRAWGFNCSCSSCSLHPSLSNASDGRLRHLESLEQEGASSFDAAQTLISLYEQERLHSYTGDAYQMAAEAACAEGNRWRTVQYALLSVEAGLSHDGFKSGNAELMQRLAAQPEKEACWPKHERGVLAAAGGAGKQRSIPDQ